MMMRDDVAYLLSPVYQTDAIGQRVPSFSRREVYCQIGSVSQSEWFDAGRIGLKPQVVVYIFPDDYAGEGIVEVGGVRYTVYRTYENRRGQLELYLERRLGADDNGC